METVKQDMHVCFKYVLTLEDGEVLDQSPEGEPLCYVHGSGNIIPGLERALEGMAPGEEKSVVVPAAEAYGQSQPDTIETLPRHLFPDDVEEGMGFRMRNEDTGKVLTVYVDSIDTDSVDVNLSHPLAGKDLHFDVEVTEVREATEEEMLPNGASGDEA